MQSAVDSKADLLARVRRHEDQIRALGVARLGLFGSFARDQHRDDSDVDVLVEFRPNTKTFDSFMRLAFLLEEVLQRRVELVTAEALSPHIGPRILSEVQDVLANG